MPFPIANGDVSQNRKTTPLSSFFFLPLARKRVLEGNANTKKEKEHHPARLGFPDTKTRVKS